VTEPLPFARYPLLDALLSRRSRRFAPGMTLDGGPLSYASALAPETLTLDEQAALAFAACGITGHALAELPYADGAEPETGGGTIMMNLVARTVASGDASHADTVFVIDDDGAWLLRRPQDHPRAEIPELVALARVGRLTELYERSRVRIADGRVDVPPDVRYVLSLNKWSANRPGTTYFLPIAELTAFAINIALILFDEDFRYFVVDDRNWFRPAGIGRFARSKGGPLHDDVHDGRVLTLAMLENLVLEFAAIEQGQPHREFSAFEPCRSRYRIVEGRKLDCDGTHGEGARRPATALAKSCNVFFFQLAEDLGEAGLRRALWRFGLLPAPADGADDGGGRLQERPPELPAAFAAAPRWRREHELLQYRGIGYAIEANPLALARAYAALATGELPTLGCRRGEERPHFALGIDEEHLEVVRTGLRECVETGTAEKIAGLRQFGVLGKTGTAEIDHHHDNNGWFAGWLPLRAADRVQLCFCAVVYCVPDKTHGAEAAGALVADMLQQMAADETLAARYLRPEGGR